MTEDTHDINHPDCECDYKGIVMNDCPVHGEDTTDELKPCPFCGIGHFIIDSSIQERDERRYYTLDGECNQCFATFRESMGWGQYSKLGPDRDSLAHSILKADLIKSWNTRIESRALSDDEQMAKLKMYFGNELNEMLDRPLALSNEVQVILKAVAHIGIDFGYGPYELEDRHIQKARELIKGTEQ